MAVTYRNTRTGRVVHMAEPLPSMERSRRWERVEPGTPAEKEEPERLPPWPDPSPAPDGPFDPAEHTVAQVNAYLADAGRGERERVLQAEAEGRARRGVLSGPHSDLSGT